MSNLRRRLTAAEQAPYIAQDLVSTQRRLTDEEIRHWRLGAMVDAVEALDGTFNPLISVLDELMERRRAEAGSGEQQ